MDSTIRTNKLFLNEIAERGIEQIKSRLSGRVDTDHFAVTGYLIEYVLDEKICETDAWGHLLRDRISEREIGYLVELFENKGKEKFVEVKGKYYANDVSYDILESMVIEGWLTNKGKSKTTYKLTKQALTALFSIGVETDYKDTPKEEDNAPGYSPVVLNMPVFYPAGGGPPTWFPPAPR